MNKTQRSRLLGAFLAIIGVLGLTEAQAQMPARFYLKSLSDGNAVPVIFNSISGNTNPFDPAHTVTPGADFDATMALHPTAAEELVTMRTRSARYERDKA